MRGYVRLFSSSFVIPEDVRFLFLYVLRYDDKCEMVSVSGVIDEGNLFA